MQRRIAPAGRLNRERVGQTPRRDRDRAAAGRRKGAALL